MSIFEMCNGAEQEQPACKVLCLYSQETQKNAPGWHRQWICSSLPLSGHHWGDIRRFPILFGLGSPNHVLDFQFFVKDCVQFIQQILWSFVEENISLTFYPTMAFLKGFQYFPVLFYASFSL